MSNWPDHTPEPGEGPRWLDWAAPTVIVIGLALLLSGSFGGRLPQITLPTFDLAQLELPRLPQSEPTPAPPSTVQITEGDLPFAFDAAPADPGAPSIQSVPFETCVAMLADTAIALGQPIIVEDTPDRHVARFKFTEGDLTVTCSRADGTMTMEQR